jgi:hypothetical protein
MGAKVFLVLILIKQDLINRNTHLFIKLKYRILSKVIYQNRDSFNLHFL